ncbi:UNVERIFIED_CONTAM: ATP-dependent RNA helicase TDRD9 [Trichonephila clavipes]
MQILCYSIPPPPPPVSWWIGDIYYGKCVDLLVKDLKARLGRLNIHSDSRHRFLNIEESNIIILKVPFCIFLFPLYILVIKFDCFGIHLKKYLMQNRLSQNPKTNQLYLAPFSQNSQRPLYYRVTMQEMQPPKATMVIAGAFFPYYYVQESLDEKTVQKSINENDPLSTVSVSGLPLKHGILYATTLKEMFACCSENISIEFEESRAYVRFLSNYDKSASLVHPAVYMALKMRRLRIPLELSVFSPEEAERKTNQLLSSKSGPSNMLVSNR